MKVLDESIDNKINAIESKSKGKILTKFEKLEIVEHDFTDLDNWFESYVDSMKK